MEMFRLCLKGFLLTIITFGIYGSWLNVSIRKYILTHIKFGNITFDFKGKGDELFWIHLKFGLLFYITLGIYTFWYLENIFKFYVENIKMYQNEKEVKFKVNASSGGIFSLVIVNLLLIVFTLGLATPWTVIRTYKFILENSVIDGELDLNSIEQLGGDDYDDASGDDFLDFLDLDLL